MKLGPRHTSSHPSAIAKIQGLASSWSKAQPLTFHTAAVPVHNGLKMRHIYVRIATLIGK
jgi:hypothetical protein